MTAADVLAEARAANVRLHATPEGKLRWCRAGPLPDRLRELLICHKAELLALLPLAAARAQPPVLVTPADLPDDYWREFWAERAAIMEYDGGLARERAEALALEDVLRLVRADVQEEESR